MKYKWLEPEDLTVKLVEDMTGKKVKFLVKGNLETGEVEDKVDDEGNPVKVPIRRKGIEIDLEDELSQSDLSQLDSLLAPRMRS